MINMNFYGSEGITLTSANHLCNLAKEYVAVQRAIIENISFVTVQTSVNGGNPITTIQGETETDSIVSALQQIAKFNAFIAYMREAIKGKGEMLDTIESRDSFIQRIWPDYNARPVRSNYITFNQVLEKKSIKEQNNYYRLEALASTIGRAIHPGGSFHEARQTLYTALSRPAYITDQYITMRKPSVTSATVDEAFFKLQKMHRDAEAQLNAIKHSIEMEVKKHNDLIDATYAEQLAKYAADLNVYEGKYVEFVNAEHTRIANLKIIVPNELKETYEFLSKL